MNIKYFGIWMLLLLILPGFLACGKPEHRDYLQYQSFPFSMEAEITCGAFTCTAEIRLHAEREMELHFRSPATLDGVILTCSGGSLSIGNGTVLTRLPSEVQQYGVAQLIRFFNLKDIWLSSVELSKESGIELNILRFLVPMTDELPGGNITVKIDGSSGTPCRFEGELGGQTYVIRVLSFTKSEV